MRDAGKRTGQRLFSILAAVALAAALLVLVATPENLRESPLRLFRTWDAPSFAAVGETGAVVIDGSKTRLSVLDADDRIRARVTGGTAREDSFYYAEYAAQDGENVYIADVTHGENSTRVVRERILRFTANGAYAGTLWDMQYAAAEMPLQLGTVRALQAWEGALYFLRLEAGGWAIYRLDGAGASLLRRIDGGGETPVHGGYDPGSDTAVWTTMEGGLFTDCGGKRARLAYGDGVNVVWGADVDEAGRVYVSDLLHADVLRLDGDSVEPVLQKAACHALQAANGRLASADGARVYLWDAGGALVYAAETARLSGAYLLRLWVSWVSVACLAGWIVFLGVRFASLLRGRVRRGVLSMGALMLLTAGLVSVFVISSYQKKLNSVSMGDLKRIANAVSATSQTTFGPAFSRLNRLEDYGNEDYCSVRRYLDAFADESYESGLHLYYILYKYDAENLWGVMDYENTNGVVYPYMPIAGSGYEDVILQNKSVSFANEADQYGMWSYVAAPVYGAAGEAVGMLEIGTNRYGEVRAQRELFAEVLSAALAATAMVTLFMGEFTAYKEGLAQRKRAEATEAALGFLRPVVFLLFLGESMDAAFVPQLSARLYAVCGWGMDENLAAALPMSAQLFAVAAASLAAGAQIDRRGIRRVLLGGGAVRLAGGILAALAVAAQSYPLFTLAKLLCGLGMGAASVASEAIPSCTEDTQARAGLFAGLNIALISGGVLGAALGAYAAQYLGHTAAYGIAAALTLLCAAACARYIPAALRPAAQTAREEAPGDARALRRFIKRPAVLGFMLLLLMPFMVMLYFKDYVFPLYGASLGYGESSIGNILLLGGVIAILTGELLPEPLFRRFGVRRTMMLASLVFVGALLLFGLRESYLTAVLALCVICAASSFGLVGQGVYFSRLAESADTGIGKAMGLYSLADNLGQTCGPLILGALLFMGFGRAMRTVALGMGVLLVLFAFCTRKEKGDSADGDS